MNTYTLGAAVLAATIGVSGLANAQDWNGFYAGANTAVSTMETNGRFGLPVNTTGITGSIFAGYNHMLSDRFMIGIEGEYNLNAATTNGGIFVASASMKNTYGLRARGGYVMDNIMFYGAVGAEVGTFGAPWAPPEFYEDATGISTAIGLEYMINDRVSIRAEYSRTDFGAVAPATQGPDFKVATESLRFGVAMHF